MDKTRAERLNDVVEKLAPQSHSSLQESGKWANRHPNPGVTRNEETGEETEARHSGAPYVIETLPDNRVRIVVTSDDGDSTAGVGQNIEEALSALEAKVAPKGGQ